MNNIELLAIWGAVTGTAGTIIGLFTLWLRYKQYRLDKAKIISEASFGFNSPNNHNHIITIRSIGRRPVTIDNIRYFITPKNLKHRITKYWQHKKGRWILNQELRQKVKLNEGEKVEIKILLPDQLNISEIYKAEVIDQTGTAWNVKWIPHSKLVRIATQEILDEFSKENEKRMVSVTGYRLGERYYLETKFHSKPSLNNVSNGRGFSFFDFDKYHKKLKDIVEQQSVKFLSGDIQELQ